MSRSGGDLTSRPAAAVASIVVSTLTARLAAGWLSSATSGRSPWSRYRWRRRQPGQRSGGVRYPRSSLEACARHRGPASWRPQNVTPKNCGPPAPKGSAGRRAGEFSGHAPISRSAACSASCADRHAAGDHLEIPARHRQHRDHPSRASAPGSGTRRRSARPGARERAGSEPAGRFRRASSPAAGRCSARPSGSWSCSGRTVTAHTCSTGCPRPARHPPASQSRIDQRTPRASREAVP